MVINWLVVLPGVKSDSSENFGGSRITTFMVYLSDVEIGGRTVFPQPGISVKPVAGTALYWFNHDNLGENDSRYVISLYHIPLEVLTLFHSFRTMHLGCPVVYGNKWIANKWIKWDAQMWRYPCGVTKDDFSVLT
jgi:prolyl 4-hydroxylase